MFEKGRGSLFKGESVSAFIKQEPDTEITGHYSLGTGEKVLLYNIIYK